MKNVKRYSRRKFLKFCGQSSLIFAGMGSAILSRCSKSTLENSRPNIILIMSDDMGFSDIGCYGSEISTPNLDNLAANGLRYLQFYNTARCCPTRASLITGLYPHQTGVGHMMSDKGNDGYRGDLNEHCLTIAQVLKPVGYSTYMAGKWHVTPSARSVETTSKHNWPLQRGFDRFFGTIHGAGSFYDPNTLVRDNEYTPPGENFYYTDAISKTASQYINEHSGANPFFMYVAYTAAHWPNHALPEDIKKYEDRYKYGWTKLRQERFTRMKEMGLIKKEWPLSPPDSKVEQWEFEENSEWHQRCMEVYAAMIDRMDKGIGQIINSLKKKGVLENTLIFFLQDNGGCAEQYGMFRDPPTESYLKIHQPMAPEELQWDMVPKFTRDGLPLRIGRGVMPGPADTYVGYAAGWTNASNTPFRMYKHWIHEGGISTPLIIHWPKGFSSKGQFRNQPGHLIDIMTTCVDVADAQYPKMYNDNDIYPMEGKSLVPSFTNNPLNREAIYWEHEGNRAIRVGRWKLVSKADPSKPRKWDEIEELPNELWELYDIEADRSEVNNLVGKYPEKVIQLAEQWMVWAKRTKVIPKPQSKT
jgi:arylsulfatase